jgi:hypothetical protein
MKTCSKCGEEKPEFEYALNKKSKSGRVNACKRCLAAVRRSVPQSIKSAQTVAHKRANPDRASARLNVYKMVRKGRMERQPCIVCGNPESQAHHEDYAKPLDVVWLCRFHHLHRHEALKGKGE